MSLSQPNAMSNVPDNSARNSEQVPPVLRDHWKALLVEGLLLMAFGAIAIVVPQLASVGATVFLGWLFLLTGAVNLATTAWSRQVCGLWWSIVSASLAIASGLIMLIWPLQATFSLTIIVGAYFMVEGIATIMFAMDHRREMTARWSLMLVSGVIDISVALVIVIGLPGSAFWTIGLLIGLNLIFGGSSLAIVALAARQRMRR